MKTLLTILSIALITNSWAQQRPDKSGKATVEQRVGLTDLSIVYSRPNVNNRVIFGELVPYNEVWRLGANQPTTMTLSYPITINNQVLDSGTYAVFAMPSANQWTVVFNQDHEQWGSNKYDPKKNVLEYTTAVNANSHTESFTIAFEAVNETSAIMTFAWDKTKVSVPFTTETLQAVQAEFDAAIAKGENLGSVYSKAASYFNNEGDIDAAKGYLKKSLEIERNYSNVFLAAVMMKDEDLKGALKLVDEAAELAVEGGKEGWAKYILEKTQEWE